VIVIVIYVGGGGGGFMHIQENHGSNINMIPLTQIHLSQDVKWYTRTIVCTWGRGGMKENIYLTMHALV